jgi:small subunit ribosomal protein S20
MAHRRSSLKKIRSDKRRREQNLRIVSELKTFARKVKESIAAKKPEDAEKLSRAFFSKLDRAVKKGILHDNRASRQKSRLAQSINRLKLQTK